MYKIGDKVVYPMHGAGTIDAIEEKEIQGTKQFYYVMNIRNMQVMFPIDLDNRIRPIVDLSIMEDVLTSFDNSEFDMTIKPNQRYRCNMNKMRTGDIYQGAEVIRELNLMGKKRNLSTVDKGMLDNALQIFVSELVLVKGIKEEQAVEIIEQLINGQNLMVSIQSAANK